MSETDCVGSESRSRIALQGSERATAASQGANCNVVKILKERS